MQVSLLEYQENEKIKSKQNKIKNEKATKSFRLAPEAFSYSGN